MARPNYYAENKNLFLEWLYKHGWEEPIDPHGPFVQVAGPDPLPWKVAIAQVVHAIYMRDLANRLPTSEQKATLVRSASTAISAFVDDYCGTRPPGWPFPGPPPQVVEALSGLAAFAYSLQPGALREEILGVATQGLAQSVGLPAAEKART